MTFLETSSLNGQNVQEAFQGLTKEVIDKQNVQLTKKDSRVDAEKKGNLEDPEFNKDLKDKKSGKKKKCC